MPEGKSLPGGCRLGGRLLFELLRSNVWSVLFPAGNSGLQQHSVLWTHRHKCLSEKRVGVLRDLAGDVLRLLCHYWKAVETGEDQRKANIVLIFRKGKKSWELLASQTHFGPWENHGAILPGRIKFWPRLEQAVGFVTSQNLSQPQWFCHSIECTYTDVFKIQYTAQGPRLDCSVTLQVNHLFIPCEKCKLKQFIFFFFNLRSL